MTQSENRLFVVIWALTVVIAVGGSLGITLLAGQKSALVASTPMRGGEPSGKGDLVQEAPAGAVNAAKGEPADGKALADSRGCMVCHNVDVKVVGPAYRDVAKKYRGDDKALGVLSAKVKSGGAGVWGVMPMPPQNQVSAEEAKTLVSWVLALSGD